MKKQQSGTGPSKAFVVETGPSWRRWAAQRSETELAEIAQRLEELKESFGKPHLHAGLGLRRLTPRLFEFRISRGIRVVFAFIKPDTFRLAMTGDHDQVRAWLKENG